MNFIESYSVRLEDSAGQFTAYLSHKGRGVWTKRTAIKYAREMAMRGGIVAKVEHSHVVRDPVATFTSATA